ncbi:sigma factor-like helix-turn-helix DNA-binding protein [Nonomuraea sp. NPDC050556]|uniref:RNA polymerase sigma factor n=1 Tax=Nonomuraea sp. NPDC050556 TaxID=3364369 RepID=UPI0037B1FE5C
MTPPLTDQPSRSALVAELYDRHAAGLFAYCADQIGDLGSAADALAAVLAGVPATPPPRAALYALARREIHRRDVSFAPPVVDPLVDPATALVERTLRELRPHQREVVLLCEACGLTHAELAWVLDVAQDTAEELAISARHRFKQTLNTALASTSARLSKQVAEVYGALSVAPLRDILGRLPWPAPPSSLTQQFSVPRTAYAGSLFLRPLWPLPPSWPLPLAETDPATSTGLFPAELLTPPSPSRVSHHEATTAPMPKITSFSSPPVARPVPLSAPVPQDYILPVSGPPEPGDVLVHKAPDPTPVAFENLLATTGGEPGSLFRPRARTPQPEPPAYHLPLPAEEPATAIEMPAAFLEPPAAAPTAAVEVEATPSTDLFRPAEPVPAEPEPGADDEAEDWMPAREHSRINLTDRHHDWAWELAGFLICLAIAMIVFFSVPMMIAP